MNLRTVAKRKKNILLTTKKNKQAEKGVVLYGLDLDLAQNVLSFVEKMF